MNYKKKLGVILLSIILSTPFALNAMPMTNFLPMEDALSAARNAPEFVNTNFKPYRQSFNLDNHKILSGDSLNFSALDIFALMALIGVYVVLARAKSSSRNVSF